MKNLIIYNEGFYKDQVDGSYLSAKQVVPVVRNILQNVGSVLDVGCGVGTWLKAWKECDEKIKVFGIDGNEVVGEFGILDEGNYCKVDLLEEADRVATIVYEGSGLKKFDLVESLEVAEHLEERYAQNFIKLLTSFSDTVLFSAAIPGQGGTEHVNEQPPKYWADLFAQFGFLCYDIRYLFWDNPNIEFWYKQNIFLFANKKNNIKKIVSKYTCEPECLAYPDRTLVKDRILQSLHNKNKDLMKYIRHPKKILEIFQ